MNAPDLVRGALLVMAAYLALGTLGAALLHLRGLPRLNPAVHGAGLGFRILITPGLIALWPLLVVRWIQSARGRLHPDQLGQSPRPEALRRAHALAWKTLAVLAPLILGSALFWRPPAVPDAPLPLAARTAVPTGAPSVSAP